MQRPIGIFIAAVILLVFGLFGLLIFSVGIFGVASMPAAHPALPPSARIVALVAEGIFAGVSLFCCWTAIGLFRMRAWARYVSIVLAALVACFSGLSAVMLILLRRMPLSGATLSGATPSGATLSGATLSPQLQHGIFAVLALVYFVLAGVSLFWVVYFNRASIRAAFAAASIRRQGEDAYGGVILPNRGSHDVVGFAQIVLWIVAVLFLLGGVSMIVLMLLGMPMFLLGWLATGPAALAMEVLWACLLIYAGLGLIFRWRGGWILALLLQLYSLLSVMLLLVPAYTARLIDASQILALRLAPSTVPNPAAAPVNASFMVAASAVGGLFALVILISLVRLRHSYLS